ncbi:MAG TPA: carboxyltransferase domain-containing protein, partial [Dermatophilaceae bacterium]|nr:carboxyltransferase domain-containing protein [Dermatophilaceae bacterium]
IIGRIGVDGALYQAMEFTGETVAALPMADRLSMANMAIEAGAKNGIFPPDAVTGEYVSPRAGRPYTLYASDPDAVYARTIEIDAGALEPQVAFPHLPSNVRGVSEAGHVEISVRYDGPDLLDVARHTGLSPREVVAAHTGMPWRVGFGGFAPGFAYLVGGDPRLTVPRRSSPRTSVPAGAVALAGDFSGIYPRESPGGWQLIGTTDVVLWDAERTPPALFTPGMVVTFVEDRS